MTFTEYQIEQVLFPLYMRLDRDETKFKISAACLFPSADRMDINTLYEIFAFRAPPIRDEKSFFERDLDKPFLEAYWFWFAVIGSLFLFFVR